MAICKNFSYRALEALKRDACKKLLTGPNGENPIDKLKELRDANRVQPGVTPMVTLPDGSQRPAIASFGPDGITLDSSFFEAAVGGLIYAFNDVYGILDTIPAQVKVLLHETGHATNAPAADHYTDGKQDSKKSQEFNTQILKDCLGLRPKR